jgi:mannosyltransferase
MLNRFLRLENPFWLAPITALAVASHLFRIGFNSLWFDETFSWLVAQRSVSAILTQRLEPFLPPLYHVLLHFWIGLGQTEVDLRLLSAICGITTVPIMYFLGRDLFSPATGWAAALLSALLPFQIYYAQEARPYALVMLLSVLVLWAFVRAWKSNTYRAWIGFGLLAGLGLYAHYFLILWLLVFHGFSILAETRGQRRWRMLLLSDALAMLIAGPQMLSAWVQMRRVTSDFWVAPPSPLQPVKTLDYLIFGHTTPLSLVPVALFLVLSILTMTILAAFRMRGETRQWLLLMLALVLIPMFLVLLFSWFIEPLYLDRSFSLVSPAYLLLLAWGFAHPPQHSPVPLLYAGLAVVIGISLSNYYLWPDPAKPPFREVSAVLKTHSQQEDVVLHLHDSSYLPLRYYAPDVESYLLNNDPEAWIPSYAWEWAGRRVSSLDQVPVGNLRLWVIIMPGRANDRQNKVLAHVESQYKKEAEWAWSSMDPVKLILYSQSDARP